MKYYAHIDANGKILGWYNDEIHCTKTLDENNNIVLDISKIPTPNIEVSEESYIKAREEKSNAYDETIKTFIIKDFRTIDDIKQSKLSTIQTTYQTESTKPVPYKDVLYKGGDASAGAISGAVTLAQSLGETNVKIIANDDSANEMSFDEALELSGLIAKAWRTVFFRYKELKVQISNATTVQELDGINW